MKLLLLLLTVILVLDQVTKATKCWGTSGRCKTTCKETEVFYILCKTGDKCCVNPKYVPTLNRDGWWFTLL
uniref:Beta-defensin n=1 Tax=Castor canadensis TaxID=51338 RepID=A0A8C0X6R3_CASCN